MKDKFRANFWIALPAAVATLIIIFIRTSGSDAGTAIVKDYDLIQVVPYLLVLIGGIIDVYKRQMLNYLYIHKTQKGETL